MFNLPFTFELEPKETTPFGPVIPRSPMARGHFQNDPFWCIFGTGPVRVSVLTFPLPLVRIENRRPAQAGAADRLAYIGSGWEQSAAPALGYWLNAQAPVAMFSVPLTLESDVNETMPVWPLIPAIDKLPSGRGHFHDASHWA